MDCRTEFRRDYRKQNFIKTYKGQGIVECHGRRHREGKGRRVVGISLAEVLCLLEN